MQRLFVVAVITVVLLSTAQAVEKINLPRDTTHPEKDAKHAIQSGDLGFVGVNGFAYTIPGVEGVYLYPRFSKNLYSQLKVIRGTSDVRRGPADDTLNDKARLYAKRYNRVLLDWIEKHHLDWLGPRQALTR